MPLYHIFIEVLGNPSESLVGGIGLEMEFGKEVRKVLARPGAKVKFG
jgi:hypothetical protein